MEHVQRKREEEEQRKRELEEKKQQQLEWRKRYIHMYTHHVYSGTLLIQASEMQPPHQWLWRGLINLYNNYFSHNKLTLKSSHLTNPATFAGPKCGWNREVPLLYTVREKTERYTGLF